MSLLWKFAQKTRGISELYWILQRKPNLSETRCKEIIVLSKTIWIERHKTYKTYLLSLSTIKPIKPLVTKLQKCNQDIYTAYQMIDNILREFKDYRDGIDIEFQHWHDFPERCWYWNWPSTFSKQTKCWE